MGSKQVPETRSNCLQSSMWWLRTRGVYVTELVIACICTAVLLPTCILLFKRVADVIIHKLVWWVVSQKHPNANQHSLAMTSPRCQRLHHASWMHVAVQQCTTVGANSYFWAPSRSRNQRLRRTVGLTAALGLVQVRRHFHVSISPTQAHSAFVAPVVVLRCLLYLLRIPLRLSCHS